MTTYQTGWTLQLTPNPPGPPVPTLDVTLPPISGNPFGSFGPPASFQTTTARTLIDSARLRHFSFTEIDLGDGAALLFLNQRQRELMGAGGATIEGLVGTAIEYAVTPGVPLSGLLISWASGVPYLALQNQDGWAMHVDENGVPFLDPSEPPVAADPLAQLGGVQGFGLPQDMVRLINVMLIFTSGSAGGNQMFVPCAPTDERQRNAMLPGRNPVAFIAGNRLVPMLPASSLFPAPSTQLNSADRWYSVAGIQISYVAIDKLLSLDDQITLPVVLCGALIAEVAKLFAMQSRKISAADKKMFMDDAKGALGEASANALDMLESPEIDSVIYNG